MWTVWAVWAARDQHDPREPVVFFAAVELALALVVTFFAAFLLVVFRFAARFLAAAVFLADFFFAMFPPQGDIFALRVYLIYRWKTLQEIYSGVRSLALSAPVGIAALVGMWLIDMAIYQREIKLVSSRPIRPLLLLVG